METKEPESRKRACFYASQAVNQQLQSKAKLALTNTLQHSSRIRLSWICPVRFHTMTHRLSTHKALTASAATNMGNRDATMRAWLSAARMDKNKKETKRKKAAAPGWRPCYTIVSIDSLVDQKEGNARLPNSKSERKWRYRREGKECSLGCSKERKEVWYKDHFWFRDSIPLVPRGLRWQELSG